jgi:endoribonuclease Dicer
VAELNEACLEAEEEAIKAGKAREDRSPDFWVHTKLPPKCLPDIVEAYIGAIFVDSEFNYAEVERFFIQHIQPYFENIDLYDTFANKHPVTFLSNFLSVRMGCMNWKIFARQLPDIGDGMPPQIVATIMVHNQIIMDHQSTSARYAKKSAAEKARDLLVGVSPSEFRAVYHCDCKSEEMLEEKDMEEVDVGVAHDEGCTNQ